MADRDDSQGERPDRPRGGRSDQTTVNVPDGDGWDGTSRRHAPTVVEDMVNPGGRRGPRPEPARRTSAPRPRPAPVPGSGARPGPVSPAHSQPAPAPAAQRDGGPPGYAQPAGGARFGPPPGQPLPGGPGPGRDAGPAGGFDAGRGYGAPPWGGPSGGPLASLPGAVLPGPNPAPGESDGPQGTGTLVRAASPLLGTAMYLRTLQDYPDIRGLHHDLRQQIGSFQAHALQLGGRPEVVGEARYLLCAFIDEVIAWTPLGSRGDGFFTQNSLLSSIEGDAFGGDVCFERLDQLLHSLTPDRDLCELYYVCISLGFRGKFYADDPGVSSTLGQYLALLYNRMRPVSPREAADLSPAWRSDAPPGRGVSYTLLPFVVAGGVAVALMVSYLGFAHALHRVTDPVTQELVQKGKAPLERSFVALQDDWCTPVGTCPPDEPPPPPRPVLAPPPAPATEEWLFSFDTNSSSIAPQFEPALDEIIARINAQVDEWPELSVEVLGRTDLKGPRAVNERLSRERAAVIAEALVSRGLDRNRLVRADGLSNDDVLPERPGYDFGTLNRSAQVLVDFGGGGSR